MRYEASARSKLVRVGQAMARRSSCALSATMTVLADMSTAPSAGPSSTPHEARTPAARGIAITLYPAPFDVLRLRVLAAGLRASRHPHLGMLAPSTVGRSRFIGAGYGSDPARGETGRGRR